MNLYVILRRGGWRSPADLEEAAARSAQVGDEEMADDIRWIRSYVLEEGGGSFLPKAHATAEDSRRRRRCHG